MNRYRETRNYKNDRAAKFTQEDVTRRLAELAFGKANAVCGWTGENPKVGGWT